MKKLYIIRHAKSSWKDFSLDDFDRPLNKRGKLNAPFMGGRLKQENVLPDIIMSSPAKRAKKTAKAIAGEIGFSEKIIYDEDIYEASVYTLDKIIRSVDNAHNLVFLFGHNPSLNMLVENYVNFEQNIPTCGIIAIEFDCNRWEDIDSSNAELISFDYPKK